MIAFWVNKRNNFCNNSDSNFNNVEQLYFLMIWDTCIVASVYFLHVSNINTCQDLISRY